MNPSAALLTLHPCLMLDGFYHDLSPQQNLPRVT